MLLLDFLYDLPDERIARYPLAKRDQSKLLVYENGRIVHQQFSDLPNHLPSNSLLVFNDTKVIPARAVFSKDSGARIELLLLQPEIPARVMSEAMVATSGCTWECMIGNKKRWKDGDELRTTLDLDGQQVEVYANWCDRDKNLVTLSWTGSHLFVDVLIAIGQIPLPPYLGRKAELADVDSYQTVYAQQNGAVAAPTAGLHFTEAVLDELRSQGVQANFVTLHVGAGTFQPIKTDRILDHDMHTEQIVFTRQLIEQLHRHEGNLVAVGTTSMRSLESLYWFGVKCLMEGGPEFFIEKDYPYRSDVSQAISADEALGAVTGYMTKNNLDTLFGETQIFITPGYSFRMVDGLVTNFHQPGSTLILLVAAFIGESWRDVYREALETNYRFLSYGDSSILWRKKKPTSLGTVSASLS
jgi:S-adenosylmethionine:tRNA ribosyltransferase-isomerase